MPSQRKLIANRRNAARSRGPTTAAGKARSSRNAHRHGFAAIALRNPDQLAQMDQIARSICGDDAPRWQYDLTLSIADSQRMLTLVRAARGTVMRQIMRAAMAQETPCGQPSAEAELPQEEAMPTTSDDAIERALTELTRLERYERRAASRRQRAIRAFVAGCLLHASKPGGRKHSK